MRYRLIFIQVNNFSVFSFGVTIPIEYDMSNLYKLVWLMPNGVFREVRSGTKGQGLRHLSHET